MKLGMIVRADDTGLGNQSYAFYKHLQPFRTMVVDISKLNGNKQHIKRYKQPWRIVKGFPTNQDCDEFLNGLDAALSFEIPYNYYLFEKAEMLGIRTYLQYNYEFLDYLQRPSLPKPTLLLAPSPWHYADVTNKGLNARIYYVPIDTEAIKARDIHQAKHFIHIVGKPAIHDRNGTDTVIAALKYVTERIKITFACQNAGHLQTISAELSKTIVPKNVTVELRGEVSDYTDNYKTGDVLLLPRKYGGLCLPMQEALAAGMPVVMTDVSPNNQRLPLEWLVKAHYTDTFMTRTEIEIYEAWPQDLADKINWFAKLNDTNMKLHNDKAKSIANYFSWSNMRDSYVHLFDPHEHTGEQQYES